MSEAPTAKHGHPNWEVGLVFGRGKTRTHSEQMRDELMESYGHLRAAAGQAVGGTSEMLTPAYDRAVVAANRGWQSTKDAFAPIYDQVRTGAANARRAEMYSVRKNNPRWPILAGLLAAGVAVGAAGAVVARRRRAAVQWEEFEPGRTLDDAEAMIGGPGDEASSAADSTRGRVTSATKKVQAGAATIAEGVSNQAGRLAESLNEKSGRQGSFAGNAERARDAGTIMDAGKHQRDMTGRAEDMASEAAESGDTLGSENIGSENTSQNRP